MIEVEVARKYNSCSSCKVKECFKVSFSQEGSIQSSTVFICARCMDELSRMIETIHKRMLGK